MIVVLLRALLRDCAELAAENLTIRQQLAVLERTMKRPWLCNRDRIFWTWLSRLWSNWRSVLVIVQPETVVRWHQLGFKLYWRWKSQSRKPGRPKIDVEIQIFFEWFDCELSTMIWDVLKPKIKTAF